MPFIYGLDTDKMKEALKLLEGTHDFRGFASSSIDPRKDTVKTIYEASLDVHEDFLVFKFVGTGFLKYQIRRMMGLIIEIGRGKEDVSMVTKVLEAKDPSISHKVAEGRGLYLIKVEY